MNDTPSPQDAPARLARLENRLTRRNRVETAVGAIVIMLLVWTGVRALSHAEAGAALLAGVGHLAAAAGVAFAVIWLLLREARNRRRSDEAPDAQAALRQRLIDESRLLGSAGGWYVLPLVPGFGLILAGAVVNGASIPAALIGAGTGAAILAFIWWLNDRAATEFDRRARQA
ncbi:hypothetical protein [Oceanicola sp. 22II-s10i]|uniref:hypothetical protein n=1 Tax=Oceanicola sp. 22II-s10i TaxID=1317116 RepID=UPI000B526CE1|nr:hypothetical protein [Oceanicola sp. 22II-s10i]